MNEHFWLGKRVFITGHTGFKGGWLALWLTKLGAQVKGYALEATTTPCLFNLANIASLLESEFGDIRSSDQLLASINDFKPDIVFHLAAQPLVRLSYREPVETFETNVLGTVHLLQSVRAVSSVKSVVVVTSDKCYANNDSHLGGYREGEALGGYDAYSASKACAEIVTNAYRQSFFSANDQNNTCHIATARAGNVIGGGDWALDRLVPDVLASVRSNRPVIIRSPNAIRPWQHVLEPVSGYMLLAQLLHTRGPEFAEAWNFGPPQSGAKTVQWITTELLKHWGNGSWEMQTRDNPYESEHLRLDCTKARERLGWMSIWSPSQTLEMTAKWHKACENEQDMQARCYSDIDRFTKDRQRMLENASTNSQSTESELV